MRVPASLVLTAAGCFSLGLSVHAQPVVGGTLNCNASTIKGTYGYAVSGFYESTPVANYGVFTSDGAGSFTGSATVSVGGAIASANFTATYGVNPNCTGTATFVSSGVVTHLALTVNANGAVIDFVETDSLYTVSGTAQPVAPSCLVSDFSGPYVYAIRGWIYSAGTPVPYADAGWVNANGNGSFTGKSTFSSGGVIFRRTLSGTYSVGAGCTGTMSVSDSLGNTGTLAITLVNNGQSALFLNTTPNTVIAGNSYRGQQNCSTGTISGPFVYSVNGFGVAPGVLVPTAYSGMGSANGSGSLTGSDYISNDDSNGVVVPRTYTASYAVNSDCSGSEVVKDSLGQTADLDFFVGAGGSRVEFVQTDEGLVISGESRPLASGTCSNATINGPYGYAASGWLIPPLSPVLAADAGAGQFTADGNGHFTGAETASFGGVIEPATVIGTYQIASNCTGTSVFTDSTGNVAHFQLVVSPDGQTIYSIETDSDTAVASFAQYQVSQPSAAIVNLGSYTTNVAPGGLITIFGSGFTSGAPQQATGAPWPTQQLGGVTVKVNGSPIPLYYVASGQIDAQLPVNLAAGTAQMVVEAGSGSTGTINFTVSPAAPGVLIYGPERAVAQDANLNYSLVGPPAIGAVAANPGDELQVYLVDGGAVSASSGAWTTGAASPSGLSSVTSNYSVTIGGSPAKVAYFGLTQGFVGLYQLNVQVPSSLPPGDHVLVVTENGVSSPGALITVQ